MSSARHKSLALWSACFALALCMHGAGAAALLAHWNENSDSVANAPAITVDLAPLPVASEIEQSELPPGPQQNEARPDPAPDPVKPVKKAELPPEPQAESLTAVMPPPKPMEKPQEKQKEKAQKQLHASLASAPASAERKAERAAAPAPGASSSRDFDALQTWKSQLVAALERSKRTSEERGIAKLAFSVDRRGGVHHARIAQSSGSAALDREALAILERAAPLPPPPPDIPDSQLNIDVPIRYNMR